MLALICNPSTLADQIATLRGIDKRKLRRCRRKCKSTLPILDRGLGSAHGKTMALTTYLGIAFLILGGLLVVVEMHTVTIYLLAAALGCFASGAVAVAGHGLDVTLGVFTGVTLLSLPIAHWVRRTLSNREAEEVTRDDVGHSVTIISAEAGKIHASYRGTVWDAPLAGC